MEINQCLKVIIADHEFTFKCDDVFNFALSDYPNISEWELRKLICMSDYEKTHGRELQIVCENDEILKIIYQSFAKPETVMNTAVPKKITECMACKQKGCLTEFVCHTTSIENAKSIFACGKILSAIKAKGKTGDELATELGNAAGDPPDFFENVMFAWGNCQAGDRIVMERMFKRMPTEQDLSIDFKPGVRFYFVHNDILNHPNYLFDGYDPAKIKDEIILSEYLFACIIPKAHEDEFRNIIPSSLFDKVFYIENDCKDIWDWWNQNHANGAYDKLAADAGDLPSFVSPGLCKVHGVCDYKQTEPGTFAYMQCAFKSKNSRIDGYTVATIPANTWVIFPSEKFKWYKVVEAVNNLHKRFYSEWLPTAEYEQANGMNFEVYGEDSNMGYVEMWYAVKKKV